MAHLTTMRDQSVDRCSAAWRESISCEQKYPVSRNIPRHIQANWFALFVKAIFVIALGVGRCGSPHHQGTGPQTILMCLIMRCTPNSALVDRVDFATSLSLSSRSVTSLSPLAPAQRAGAQRLCALAPSDGKGCPLQCRLWAAKRTRFAYREFCRS